jgi:hypothetical protein
MNIMFMEDILASGWPPDRGGPLPRIKCVNGIAGDNFLAAPQIVPQAQNASHCH